MSKRFFIVLIVAFTIWISLQIPPVQSEASFFTIQVAAYPNETPALSLEKTLVKKGYPAYVEYSSGSKKTTYRVRLGRFKSKDEALSAAKEFSEKEKMPYWITLASQTESRPQEEVKKEASPRLTFVKSPYQLTRTLPVDEEETEKGFKQEETKAEIQKEESDPRQGAMQKQASNPQGVRQAGEQREPFRELPERLQRQVSPTPSAPWRSPDLRGYTSVLKSAERSPIDPQKRYELVELIDLAQRLNPETRVAWEAARQAAIGVGLVESEYFPVLALSALGGYQSEAFPAPKNVAPSGFFRGHFEQTVPVVNLRWLLLDFGRRGRSMDAAKERLLSANLGFNRKHQEIIFRVQRAFLGLTSLRGKIAVAQSSVDSARAVRESAEAQLRNGLATLPEVSLARQQEAQATFDLEDVLATERDAQVGLAESIGIPPTTPIQVADFSSLPPPAALEESVEKVIDRALEKRPDLIAKVAALRGKEAEVRRARAAYFPTLSLVSNFNTLAGRVKVTGGTLDTGWFSAAEPSYGVGLFFEWNLFEGGATHRRVELAEAERRAAEDEVTAARDRAIREVWKAYTDVRLAVRRLDVAAALVDASQKSYEAILESYRHGLGTLIDLLAARRELSRARFVELDTKLQLLNASAALAFSTGESRQNP